MATLTDPVAGLLKRLRDNGIMEPAQLDLAARQAGEQGLDQRGLVRHMVQQDWLTPFQANQIMQGRGSDLVLGQYVLLERLGEGGMGQVFKARHQKMGRIVALKVIRKEHLNNPLAVRRFRREMQAAAQLSHPNIVVAYDADEVGDSLFFAMEYVEGIDLGRLIKESGPLPVAEACDYLRQAALGLQHAHERGMVHRDIKPPNLLVSRPAGLRTDGAPVARPLLKILDMGLARLSDNEGAHVGSLLTQDGKVVGTPDYMAPEQARNSHTTDIRADLYSLGCTAYYLLTGQVLFQGGTAMEKLFKHQMEEPRPVEQLRPEVPPAVGAIVRRLLAKRPEGRYQTPADLARALEPFVPGESLASASHSSVSLPWSSGADRQETPMALKEARTTVQPEPASPWAELTVPSPVRSPRTRRRVPAAVPVAPGGTAEPSRRLLVIGILGTALLGLLLGWLYWKFGHHPSNRSSEGPRPARLVTTLPVQVPTRDLEGPTARTLL